MHRSIDSATRTPDRIAADVLLARASNLEENGKHADAQELRARAERLLGDVTGRILPSSRKSKPPDVFARVARRVLSAQSL